MKKPFFKSDPAAPAALTCRVERRVRFEEVDTLGIVWHGRYPSYLEDVREALGDRYGIGYMDFFANGVVAPIKQLYLDYHLPLHLHEKLTIEGRLHWTEAARLNLDYRIYNAEGRLATSAFSIQMMLDRHSLEILMITPPFYREFLERWQGGILAETV